MNIAHWKRTFEHNTWYIPEALWRTPTLSALERETVAAAIQHFQLGEGSDGRGLLRRSAEFGDAEFVECMRLFIGEEQRHSAMLGRFLDLERIPRLGAHWLDGIFRRVRALAGFELMITVLVTAEIMAVPFYRALRAATGSALLQAICDRILEDEANHLVFQRENLRATSAHHSLHVQHAILPCRAVLLVGTAVIVWATHLSTFRAGGYSLMRVLRESWREFEHLNRGEEFTAAAPVLDTLRS